MYILNKISYKGYEYHTEHIDNVYWQLRNDCCDDCLSDCKSTNKIDKISHKDLYSNTDKYQKLLEEAIHELLATSCGAEYILEDVTDA